MENQTNQEWVVLVSGEGECFIATEGFASEQEANDFACDNRTAYAKDWTVEVCTKEEAEKVCDNDE